ncbi:hypothetical protein [Inquilinus sp. Marseille-Q2685]|uniref:hypothetical protein n=1 Tax=Inquilinus sp. Marseille-Q2685 TaxID=2866581 RepID=UPI001CE49111|nr:hypothetical protein [Inquilinus sp. Marseille-Q2685]
MRTVAAASPDDGPARALLDHPETYPGLIEHGSARQLLRLWRYPSFAPWCSWAVIEARSGLFLRRVVWDRHDRSGKPQPVTYGCEAPLRPEMLATVLGELAVIRLTPFPTVRILGLDGTGCGVEQGDLFGFARFEWWDVRHPEDWGPLHQWHERTAGRLDALLPARSIVG